MSTTPNLLISHVAPSQNNKETTLNASLDDLDMALCGHTSLAMADADYTVVQGTALENMLLIFTGSLSTDRNVILPAHAKPYIVINNTSGSPSQFDLTFKVGTGAAVAVISDGNPHLIFSDGVNSIYKVS
jgi:hypothetical protein